MSFGESVFPVGFNQKTAKEDLFVKGNHGIPPCKQRGKTLEDSRRISTKAEPEPLPGGADRSVAPGFKNKTRYTTYVSPKSQISHIATNKGNIKRQCLNT